MNEIDKGFEQVAAIIENARANAFRKVNEELRLYSCLRFRIPTHGCRQLNS